MTRLADVTRLDSIGFPVWQAVRPMSRALSVHQGKGASDADAQLGALLEAAECHAAETFAGQGPHCRLDALPERGRPCSLDDFAIDRARPPDADQVYLWVEAEELLTGGPAYLPFEIVTLDFTRDLAGFDRASNGIATGATREEAIATALHELIERDAVIEWQATGLFARMACALDPATVPFDWFHFWRERIEGVRADLLLYLVPSLTGTPVFACEINDPCKSGRAYGAIQGRGCHPLPEIALFKALAEALQGRTTYIAGARDDMLPDEYAAPEDSILIAFGLPLPPGMSGVDFASVAVGPVGAAAVAENLACAGYDRIALVELARPEGLHIVRMFVSGLGSMCRRRRPPH